jgi:hypothetical protein
MSHSNGVWLAYIPRIEIGLYVNKGGYTWTFVERAKSLHENVSDV